MDNDTHNSSNEGDPEADPFMREFARREASARGRVIPREEGAEAYAIDDGVASDALTLPGETAVAPEPDRLVDVIAADLTLHAIACVRTFGDFHLALSGGQTPVKLYERLMYDPNCRAIPWRKTHLWLVEEQRVPLDDPRSVYGLVKETIVQHSDIPAEQVHPIAITARDAAGDYERTLRETLGWRERGHDRLDYVLLGLGPDGSTAGLAPGSEAAAERIRLMAAIPPRGDEPSRVTMTLALINAARFVAMVATGESKADAIRRIARRERTRPELPAGAIAPVGGHLKWYVDWAAAGPPTESATQVPPSP